MKPTLCKTATRLGNEERKAFVRRVMWMSFEERLKSVFAEIDNLGHESGRLGNLYLTTHHTSNPAYRRPGVYRHNSLNQAQISTGWRRLGVWHAMGSNPPTEPDEAMEAGAGIRFSQDITGKMMVTLYPYKSGLAEANEEDFILVYGAHPNTLTKEAIRRLLKTFFRYCAATSMISAGNHRDYLFRRWLALRDIRNRKIRQIGILRLIEQTTIFALAAAGAWALAVAGHKWLW